MGKYKLAYAGMDDAGEMSSWYVFNAMGFYPFSPADPRYIVSVPLFDKVDIKAGNNKIFTILRRGKGKKIREISVGDRKIEGYFLADRDLKSGKKMVIITR